MKRLGKIGMVARWRPVHVGQAAVLRALAESGDEVLIGIGSSNRYDLRNPFTCQETVDMIRLVLGDPGHVRLIHVPDLGDPPRWRGMVAELFGDLDLFVTDNPWVASLMRADYRVIRPVELVPRAERAAVDGTMVRRAMARGDEWQELVPEAVASYIIDNGLDRRFRREFGLEALASELVI